ncbi:MAG: CHAP domain-containing protein [Firmicutes bacterium]|jgi:surface antigen|nr:CHAP domain-containing protein [Bacillota bacterium]
MRQRAAAGLLLILAIITFYNMTTWQKSPSIREHPPVKGAAGAQFYYHEDINPFYPDLAPYGKTKKGYITGNCTWYAWGRACEIAGRQLPHMFIGNAGTWWEQNRERGWYPYGQEPRRGAIACYATHVAIVEQAEPLLVSESGWKVAEKKEAIYFNCGRPWNKKEDIVGYIYVNGT